MIKSKENCVIYSNNVILFREMQVEFLEFNPLLILRTKSEEIKIGEPIRPLTKSSNSIHFTEKVRAD